MTGLACVTGGGEPSYPSIRHGKRTKAKQLFRAEGACGTPIAPARHRLILYDALREWRLENAALFRLSRQTLSPGYPVFDARPLA